MPDSKGRLSEDEKNTVRTWLREKWTVGAPICPVSGHQEWIVADHLVQMFIHTERGLVLGGPIYPQVLVICAGCAYTLFFNAVMLGLLPPSLQEESSGGEESDGTK